MTVGGAVTKTLVLALLMMLSLAMWHQLQTTPSYLAQPEYRDDWFGDCGFGLYLVSVFVPAIVVPVASRLQPAGRYIPWRFHLFNERLSLAFR